jgi:hypothetical protein
MLTLDSYTRDIPVVMTQREAEESSDSDELIANRFTNSEHG